MPTYTSKGQAMQAMWTLAQQTGIQHQVWRFAGTDTYAVIQPFDQRMYAIRAPLVATYRT